MNHIHVIRQTFFFLLLVFSISACKSGPDVNLTGKWEITQVSPARGDVKKDISLSQVMFHFTVGNSVEFTSAGEVNIHKKLTGEDVFFGLGTYKLEDKGSELLIASDGSKLEKFHIREADNEQVELFNRKENVKLYLQRPAK